MSLPMAGGLEHDNLYGPFQANPFYNSYEIHILALSKKNLNNVFHCILFNKHMWKLAWQYYLSASFVAS